MELIQLVRLLLTEATPQSLFGGYLTNAPGIYPGWNISILALINIILEHNYLLRVEG